MIENIDEIRRKYSYDPATGKLTWRIKTNAFKGAKYPGDEAGSLYSNGRYMAPVKGKPELVHRIAWVLMTGTEPPKCIDHIDRDPTNNKWGNLREATMKLNQGNRSPTKGRELPTGVRRTGKRFAATMTQNGKSKWLGSYATIAEAEAVYRAEHARYFC